MDVSLAIVILLLFWKVWGKSIMYIRNRKGPGTDPCGTPVVISSNLLLLPFPKTYCDLHEIYSSIFAGAFQCSSVFCIYFCFYQLESLCNFEKFYFFGDSVFQFFVVTVNWLFFDCYFFFRCKFVYTKHDSFCIFPRSFFCKGSSFLSVWSNNNKKFRAFSPLLLGTSRERRFISLHGDSFMITPRVFPEIV